MPGLLVIVKVRVRLRVRANIKVTERVGFGVKIR